jgi:hypothetical protein
MRKMQNASGKHVSRLLMRLSRLPRHDADGGRVPHAHLVEGPPPVRRRVQRLRRVEPPLLLPCLGSRPRHLPWRRQRASVQVDGAAEMDLAQGHGDVGGRAALVRDGARGIGSQGEICLRNTSKYGRCQEDRARKRRGNGRRCSATNPIDRLFCKGVPWKKICLDPAGQTLLRWSASVLLQTLHACFECFGNHPAA